MLLLLPRSALEAGPGTPTGTLPPDPHGLLPRASARAKREPEASARSIFRAD